MARTLDHLKEEPAGTRRRDLSAEIRTVQERIASQQNTVTLLLKDQEETDRRFARLETAVFGSKH